MPVSEQLTLAVYYPIAMHPTCDVLLRSADTISAGQFPFAHQHVPARPATVSDDQGRLMMLDLAETGQRYNQAGQADPAR